MLEVIALGSGLIPRGHGIAPRKTPFKVDRKTLKLFTETPGLQIYAINPETGAKVRLDASNYSKQYDLWADEKYKKSAPAPKVNPTPITKPYVPQPKKEEPKVEQPKVEQPQETKEEPKEETPVIPVIQNPNNQNQNNQNKNKNKN